MGKLKGTGYFSICLRQENCSLFFPEKCNGSEQGYMAPNRRFVFGVGLEGVCADFYRGRRPITAEWLGVDVATLSERVP
jgi:hypothetical protein